MKKIISSVLLLISLFAIANTKESENFVLPKGFHKGVGLSAYQNGGHIVGESNWSTFEDSYIYANAKGMFGPAIKNNEKVGKSAGFWQRAIEDVQLIKELNCNAFRFSIEWADVEPIPGEFNESVLSYYEQLIDELLKNNITPMITLYHFVHPKWFDQLGGFEKAENIKLFIRYCIKMFERFSGKVQFWCTINEPTVVAACGYVLGLHPPAKFFKFFQSGMVLRNLLNAHVAVYHTLKALPNGEQSQIGIVHQLLQAESFDANKASNWLIGLLKKWSGAPVAQFLNVTFAHQVVKLFLHTGEFDYTIPALGMSINARNVDAPNSYDFIGLNFYSRVVLGPHPTCYPDQVMTDMEYPMYPESMYEAIVDMADLGKPIYITENGLADADDSLRASFIKKYLSQVFRAIADGYDVRGYYYWTLMDNFEWNDGFGMKFGLYHTDYQTQKRTLREGAKVYRDLPIPGLASI
jgi:beta-glucosidase